MAWRVPSGSTGGMPVDMLFLAKPGADDERQTQVDGWTQRIDHKVVYGYDRVQEMSQSASRMKRAERRRQEQKPSKEAKQRGEREKREEIRREERREEREIKRKESREGYTRANTHTHKKTNTLTHKQRLYVCTDMCVYVCVCREAKEETRAGQCQAASEQMGGVENGHTRAEDKPRKLLLTNKISERAPQTERERRETVKRQ